MTLPKELPSMAECSSGSQSQTVSLRGLYWGQKHFFNFHLCLIDTGSKCTLSKFTADTELCGPWCVWGKQCQPQGPGQTQRAGPCEPPPIPPAVLCPALEAPAQETHGHDRAGPEEAHKSQSQGLREHPLLRLEKKSLWTGLPGPFPDTAVGDFYEKQRCFTKACSDRMKSPRFKLIQGSFRLKGDNCSAEGAETVEQVSQRSCGHPMPGSVWGLVAWGFEQPGPMKDIPAHFRVGREADNL